MITIWHNPRCSKSRQTLALIEESGADHTIRKYLEDAPTLAELETAQRALGVAVIDMLRPSEKQFKELGLTRNSDAGELLKAAADHPILVERPIVFSGTRAIIGRPPEAVQDLL
ncbi:arsenate reductase (glutaredoxin) [Sulfitobacter donghicola]|uniref:Arsenate reductase n=1 Tax=Sulfitobacter donghicola DSW-25 = KCTC 12864 = JCM 14565 TaxID=1300350 RepID=A0A073ICN6_9RHOB|nr:arsenate reductase (glutaredoxin) [Sulfitobacter donghicola]KEJ88078.1 arsenate reductase [Sulfitobacter donghicola DSW-25 = KCTC 12864 = JCM 14565]KIN68703.1 Arsenate reductase [Sulfitobacter donghicola DSW-25 = KCTC 12864 = JCM 14565]